MGFRWEDYGEWLEPPRTDGKARAFRLFNPGKELEGKSFFILPEEIDISGVPEDTEPLSRISDR